MAKVVLVVGLTGAGKSSYCDDLAKRERAAVYSIDHWMKSLFWQDMPKEPDMKWFQENSSWYLERMARCEGLIEAEMRSLLENGISVILDLGFTARSHRAHYVQIGKLLQAETEIHFLDVPEDERWKRVQRRNAEKGSTYSMQVSREMYDYIKAIFEPVDDSEKQSCHRFFSIPTNAKG